MSEQDEPEIFGIQMSLLNGFIILLSAQIINWMWHLLDLIKNTANEVMNLGEIWMVAKGSIEWIMFWEFSR